MKEIIDPDLRDQLDHVKAALEKVRAEIAASTGCPKGEENPEAEQRLHFNQWVAEKLEEMLKKPIMRTAEDIQRLTESTESIDELLTELMQAG